MKVFISWSGPVSKRLGEAIRDWLPGVIQLVEPYFTPSDIEKGGRWASDIAKELSNAEIGILCVTRDNIHSDWLLFEAGALSKSLEKSYVCPILFGINNADLAGPLKQFQTTEFSRADIHKLITVINGRLGDRKLASKTLDRVFDMWWPDLEAKINGIMESITIVDGPVREDREVIDEILLITRSLTRHNSASIPSSVLVELFEGFIALHDQEASESGSYSDSLDLMKEMLRPLRYLAKKSNSPDVVELTGRLSALSFETQRDLLDEDNDIPF